MSSGRTTITESRTRQLLIYNVNWMANQIAALPVIMYRSLIWRYCWPICIPTAITRLRQRVPQGTLINNTSETFWPIPICNWLIRICEMMSAWMWDSLRDSRGHFWLTGCMGVIMPWMGSTNQHNVQRVVQNVSTMMLLSYFILSQNKPIFCYVKKRIALQNHHH